MSLLGEVSAAHLMLADVTRRQGKERSIFVNKALTHVNRAIESVDSTVIVACVAVYGKSATGSVLMMLIQAQRRLSESLMRPDDLRALEGAQEWLTQIVGTFDQIDVFEFPKVAR